MAISFTEMSGSPTVNVTRSGVTGTRIFRVDWSDRYDFAAQLMGGWVSIGAVRVFKNPIPFPGLSIMLVDGVNIEPHDPEGPRGTASIPSVSRGVNDYQYAKVTAQYRQPEQQDEGDDEQPDIPEGTVLEVSQDLGGQLYSVPGRHFKWSNGDQVNSDQSPGVLVTRGQHTFTWSRVPQPPWNAIRALRGKLNDATFAGFGAGTLLFEGAQVRKRFEFRRTDASNYYDLTYNFAEEDKRLSTGAKVGWNYFYKREAVAGEHWVAIENEDGDPVFEDGDFNDLFQI